MCNEHACLKNLGQKNYTIPCVRLMGKLFQSKCFLLLKLFTINSKFMLYRMQKSHQYQCYQGIVPFLVGPMFPARKTNTNNKDITSIVQAQHNNCPLANSQCVTKPSNLVNTFILYGGRYLAGGQKSTCQAAICSYSMNSSNSNKSTQTRPSLFESWLIQQGNTALLENHTDSMHGQFMNYWLQYN